MLAVQVQYWNLQETIRSDKAREAETQRSNKEQEKISWSNLAEITRHNKVVEEETQRHNMAQEDYWSSSLLETAQHNRATEAVDRMNAASNRLQAEAAQFNAYANYSLGLEANRISAANARTNAFNANLRQAELDLSTRRQNYAEYAGDQEIAKQWFSNSNQARDVETRREAQGTNEQELELAKKRQKHQVAYDWAEYGRKSVDTAGNTFRNIMSAVPSTSQYSK